MNAPKPKRGRPPKPVLRRAGLSLRVRDEVRDALHAAAASNQRSVSQEAEFRIEASFRDQRMVEQVLEFTYGTKIAGLLLVLARALHETARAGTRQGPADWIDTPHGHDQLTRAATGVLEALRPAGEIELPADWKTQGYEAGPGADPHPGHDPAQRPSRAALCWLLGTLTGRAFDFDSDDWAAARRAQIPAMLDRIEHNLQKAPPALSEVAAVLLDKDS